jgi:hypothetical protein
MPARAAPSLARDFFDRFLQAADQVAFLRGLVNSTPLTYETEWLEFKPYPHANPEDTIKEIWSKNLSAFANTQGGVLVWGISARKVQRVEAARGIRLVPDPEELRTRLYELHHQATDPPLQGLDVRAVIDPNEGGKGFVVCFIPEGQFVPYRAEHCAMHYYVRVGDDSIVPNRAILRRLFYPQSLAKFKMSVVLSLKRGVQGQVNVSAMSYECFLMNEGTASAMDTYIVAFDNVRRTAGGEALIPAENWIRTSLSPNKCTFQGRVPIHPGFSSQVATSIQWNPPKQEVFGNVVYPDFDPIWMTFHVYSRDAEYRCFRAEFSKHDLREASTIEKICADVTPGAE